MEPQEYLIPAEECRTEIIISNSRFIATAAPVFNIEQAKKFISGIKNELNDASHHVPAYIIGHGSSITMHCSDAGEPSGTAGKPALAVLGGSGLGDIAVVVTRYFGGTKLGKGGLIRAYGNSVKAVLEKLPLARKCLLHQVMFSIPYPLFDQARILTRQYSGKFLEEIFSVDVTMVAYIPVNHYEDFQRELIELTNGKIEIIIIETDYFIIPVDLNETSSSHAG